MGIKEFREGSHSALRFGAAAVATAVVVLGLAACSSSSTSSTSSSLSKIPPGPIKLGALFALNGPDAAFGANEKAIETILVTQLNASGGISGHKVQLIALNDQGNPTDAVSTAEQLVSDHVAAVAYAGTGAVNSDTAPIFMKAKIPVVTYDPTDTWATGTKWPYLFDTYQLNVSAMKALVVFAEAKGYTKVALLTDGSGFAKNLISDFKKEIKGTNIKVATSVTYPATAVSVSTQLTQAKSSGAQAIVLLAQGGLGAVYSGLSSMGWLPPILGTATAYFEAYTSLGSLASTTYANCGVAVRKGQSLDPASAKVVKAVIAKTGPQPDYASTIINVNDDLLVIKYAIEKDHSITPNAFAKTVESIHHKSFTSSNYLYTFSATNHDGWPASQSHMCYLSPLGEDGTPVIATS